MVDKIFLGLGSNIGDRLSYLKYAVDEIRGSEKCRVLNSSHVYETKPFGNIQQDNYYNAVIEIETLLGFFDLFYLLKSIETKAGRNIDHERNTPRELDIDIIFYNELIYEGDMLSIPHKEYANRDFVLQPLLEIASEFKHPVVKKKLKDIHFGELDSYIIKKVEETLL